MSFWDDLFATKKMIMGLSPMDGVTDAPMRYMSAKYGSRYSSAPVNQYSSDSQDNRNTEKPENKSGVDLLITEFVSVDALAHAKEEKAVGRIMKTFLRAQDIGELADKPYEVAQVFGHTPELFYQAAVMIATLGFDGMDINMGCPMHKVEDQGSGAGLIRTPEVAKEIVRQSRQGMIDFAAGKVRIDDTEMSEAIKKWVKRHAKPTKTAQPLPISVKTRIGVNGDVAEEWMDHLMEVNPANISLHGRTLRQLYQGMADWAAIGRAAAVVHKHGGHLLGNGDIQSIQDLGIKIQDYGVDGGLIGRAAEGNPGIFLQGSVPCKICGLQGTEPCMHTRLAWMIEHAKIFEQVFGVGNFMPMRKHLAWYCKGFPGAVEMRSKLMLTGSVEEVEKVIQDCV